MADQLPSLPAEPATWPKPIGIISIIWGGLGLACNSCGFFRGAFQNMMLRMVPPEKQAEVQQQMDASKPWAIEYAFYVVGLLLSILLLSAGIATVRRRPQGRPLHMAYGGLSLILLAGVCLVQLMKMPEQLKHAQAQTGPGAGIAGPAMIGGLIFGMTLGAAWPVFTLIWFAPAKRAAQLDGGGDAAPVI